MVGFVWWFALFITGIRWLNLSIQQFGGLPVGVGSLLASLLAAYLSLYPVLFAPLPAPLSPYRTPSLYALASPTLRASHVSQRRLTL
ncbi:hypothetical protein J2R62_18460, partial [Plesiomonas shigelloides]|nr:hypothetical protein [Plesiomonas shigelloides]